MLKIEKHDINKYCLRQQIGEGEHRGDKFEIATNLIGTGFLFRFPEAMYTVSLDAIADEVIARRESDLENEEKGE